MGSDTIWMKIWDQIPRFNELLEEYNNMLHRLEHECQDEKVDYYTDICNMTIRTINHVVKSRTVKERFVNMNGRILELPTEKIRREERGITLINLVEEGLLGVVDAAKHANMSVEMFSEKLNNKTLIR